MWLNYDPENFSLMQVCSLMANTKTTAHVVDRQGTQYGGLTPQAGYGGDGK
jgi:hypothetical protein